MSSSKIFGYRRADNSFGIRNYVAIMPSVICANEVAKRIADQVENTVVLPHNGGCGTYGDDIEKTFATLSGLGANPNIAGVLIVGLGCESVNANKLKSEILKKSPGKMVESIVIQEEHGTSNTIKKGVTVASNLVRAASMFRKTVGGIEDIIFAIECGELYSPEYQRDYRRRTHFGC